MSTATANFIDDLKKLPVSDRLEIIDELWESIPDDQAFVSKEVIDEMNRRFEDYKQNPERGKPWSEVRAELLSGR